MSMTEVRVRRGGPEAVRGEMLLVPVAEGQLSAALRRLDRRVRGPLARRARAARFRGKAEETLVHHGETAVALLGLGPVPVGLDAWRRAGARGRQEAERERARRAGAYLGDAAAEVAAAFVEGFQLAGYRFAGYLSDPERRPRVQALTLAGEGKQLGAPLARVAAVVQEIFHARDLVNEPASVATPRFLAERVAALARDIRGLEAEAWAPKRIASEGLTGLLAVARGAAVIGAVAAAARLDLPVDVTAFAPATENLPGGQAQKPGDVIRFLNGKTVEVLNTDAEGRLVLADALALASREKPDAVIDLATLTGSCRAALGTLFAGVMGNDERLVAQLIEAGRAAGEPLWQLPLVREYREDLKSPIADLKNVGGEAGTITAGLFLEEFVDGVPWAHLDIAGPAFTEKDLPHAPRGATGFGVRLLVRCLQRLADEGAGLAGR